VDLTGIVGVERRGQKDDKHHQFYLPQDKFFENTETARKELVAPYIATACYNEGFALRMRGWNAKLQRIEFICNYGRRFDT
jgi:hypothetical protein